MAFCPEIIKIIKKGHFDLIVVGGYSTPTGMVLINYLKRKKVKFILNSDGGIIKGDNSLKYKTGNATINSETNYVEWICDVDNGHKYTVRCRAVRDGIYGDWTIGFRRALADRYYRRHFAQRRSCYDV